MNRTLREAGGFIAAALAWAIIVVGAVLLAAVVGPCLLARKAWQVLIAWPEPVESRSDREARLLDPHQPWLDSDYDMDAELAQLVAEEDARKRRFPAADGGSVRGWLTLAGALVGLAICAVISFVVFAVSGGAF